MAASRSAPEIFGDEDHEEMQGLMRGSGASQHWQVVSGESGHPLSPGPQRIGALSQDMEAAASEEHHQATLQQLEEAHGLEIEESSGGGDEEERERRSRGKLLPLWQVWPSENTFFCRGLMMTGGSEECWAPNICVWSCIMVPCSLFFYWVFPSLWRRGAYALPVAVLVVFIMTTGLLLATCCTDPGIIPRREVILATRCAAELQAALGYDVLGGSSSGNEPTLDKKLKQRGYRWCRTCRIVRPPRASHCSDCDNCVLRYDHHCPFVNNCVGQRNYHFFFGFITSVLVLAMLVIPSVLTFFSALNSEVSVKQMSQVSSSMWLLLWALALGGLLVILAAVLGLVLWVYHVFLMSTNQTTKEYRKSIPNLTEEPTICARRGPALFDPWTLVDPDDLIKPRNSESTSTRP